MNSESFTPPFFIANCSSEWHSRQAAVEFVGAGEPLPAGAVCAAARDAASAMSAIANNIRGTSRRENLGRREMAGTISGKRMVVVR
jgi:hypothetical protein